MNRRQFFGAITALGVGLRYPWLLPDREVIANEPWTNDEWVRVGRRDVGLIQILQYSAQNNSDEVKGFELGENGVLKIREHIGPHSGYVWVPHKWDPIIVPESALRRVAVPGLTTNILYRKLDYGPSVLWANVAWEEMNG